MAGLDSDGREKNRLRLGQRTVSRVAESFPPISWTDFYQRPRGGTMKGLTSTERHSKNRRDKKSLVDDDRSHGVLLYDRESPIGWCAYGLKQEFPRIDNGRNYRRMNLENDPEKLWRITCFFV